MQHSPLVLRECLLLLVLLLLLLLPGRRAAE
jgi:hypothetical protein